MNLLKSCTAVDEREYSTWLNLWNLIAAYLLVFAGEDDLGSKGFENKFDNALSGHGLYVETVYSFKLLIKIQSDFAVVCCKETSTFLIRNKTTLFHQ